MTRARHVRLGLALGAAAVSGACGLEALFDGGAASDEHTRPVTVVTGRTSLFTPMMSATQPDGTAVEVVSSRSENGDYRLALPAAAYTNLRIVATQGEALLKAVLPEAAAEQTVEGFDVSAVTTAVTLMIEAKLTPAELTFPLLTPGMVRSAQRRFGAALTGTDAGIDFHAMVERVLTAADTTAGAPAPEGGVAPPVDLAFQVPVLDADHKTVTSAINPTWLAHTAVDFDGDGTDDTTSVKFDGALEALVESLGLGLCLDPERLRVVMAVDFNDGRKDGNCDAVNRFKWVRDEPGKQMFFTGGVHEESPIQDLEADDALGSWIPNQNPMYDDGSNGDEVAGDNVWTIAFVLPKGLRIGYKYTWGKQGALWTGSEEWPGNQRLLEVFDVNGDNIVHRRDHFGDEATNKDKVNLNRRGRGTVTWDTDVNRDDVPDARERMVDEDNDCVLDEWVKPTRIGPATVDCEQVTP
jgi:hypothetical protein